MDKCESSLYRPLPSSFRDPGGRLFTFDGRIIRIVSQSCVADLQAFLGSSAANQAFSHGRVVRTHVLSAGEAEKLLKNREIRSFFDSAQGGLLIEHGEIPFPTYPYEWPPEMLHAAGCLTLDLAESLLREGLGLKDATPYNILFQGPEPVFVDILSFERRLPGDPVWLPYAQFIRTFLLPLLVNKYFGWSLDQLLMSHRDGVEPEQVYRACGSARRCLPPFLTLATIPTWLAARHHQDDTAIYQRKVLNNPEKAQFILGSLFRRLRRQLRKFTPAAGTSTWSDYLLTSTHYSPADFAVKHKFVEDVLSEFRPQRILDIGCNTGYFSVLAAKTGARVVAMDQDPVVVGELWRRARAEGLDVLPLVNSLTRPSPGIGWRNQECASFLDRARGSFDAVFMLALMHHVVVNERVPLQDLLDLAGELTSNFLLIEFVAPDDLMFRRIARGRDYLFVDLTRERFETACRRRFEQVRSQPLDATSRWLYLLSKKK